MSAIGEMVNKTVMGVIGAVIFVLIGVALGPTVIEAVSDINATSMAEIPLGTVIVLLSGYVPAFYYLAIVLGGIAMIWASARGKD